MLVLGAEVGFVQECSLELYGSQETGSHQLGQRVVHGGPRYTRHCVPGLPKHFLGGEMLVSASSEGLLHCATLRGDPHPTGPQRVF